MKKRLTILFMFCSLMIQAQTTHYIETAANGGSNSNAGTEASPWLTLSYACSHVTTSGDIIHVGRGTFVETSQCVLSVGVSIVGEGKYSIISNSNLTAEWNPIISAESVTQTNGNQSISYLAFEGNDLCCQAIAVIGRNNVAIHHCRFTNFVWEGVTIRSEDATGQEVADEPTVFSTGCSFYNNYMNDCAGLDGTWLRGSLLVGSTEGLEIYNDTILCVDGPTTAGVPIKFWYWGGWHKGTKIHDCYIEKDNDREYADYGFAIESVWSTGWEIYNNTIIGSIDPNDGIIRSPYTYSLWIHDNILGPASRTSAYFVGVTLEYSQPDVIIERNHFRNNSPGILLTTRTSTISNLIIRYNIFDNLTENGTSNGGIVFMGEAGYTVSSMYVYNNVFHANPTYPAQIGVDFDWNVNSYTIGTLDITNNIFVNLDFYWLELNNGSGCTNLYTRNNLRYNCGNSNAYTITGTPTYHYNTNNIIGNPLFTASDDFTLQSGSPARDAGIDVGLTTDYLKYTVPFNSIQDIGAYEYGASLPGASTVVKSSTGVVLKFSDGNAFKLQ